MAERRADVLRYYDAYDEWGRLERPAGRLEYLRTCQILARTLDSDAHGRVLDLGGGPGRYSIELARAGHEVVLADLSAHQLAVARQRLQEAGLTQRVRVVQADAAEPLDEEDASFDAALCMGPLYHLPEADDRARVAAELARVVRPGGLVLASFIPWLSGLRGLILKSADDPARTPAGTFFAALTRGSYFNPGDHGLRHAFFATPEEITERFADAGIVELRTESIRGLAAGYEEAFFRLAPGARDEVLAVIAETAARPEVVAMSDHALFVGQRSGGETTEE